MRIVPRPLTAEAFRPYGCLAGEGAATLPVNEGRGRRRDLFYARSTADAATVVARYDLLPSALPVRIAEFERHPRSDQLFVALTATDALLVVAPSLLDGSPDLEEAEAFIAAPDAPFVYLAGTWHAPLIALGRAGAFLMSMTETHSSADCEIVAVTHSLIVAAPHGPGEARA